MYYVAKSKVQDKDLFIADENIKRLLTYDIVVFSFLFGLLLLIIISYIYGF